MLEVPVILSAAWRALAPAARSQVEAFLGGAAPCGVVVAADAIPEPFAQDLARGGGRLRAAFPRLARRVVAIEPGPRLAIRVACDGVHDGEFYGFLRASRRRVRFDELHELIVDGGVLAWHRVAIDLRAIVRQLSARDLGSTAAFGA